MSKPPAEVKVAAKPVLQSFPKNRQEVSAFAKKSGQVTVLNISKGECDKKKYKWELYLELATGLQKGRCLELRK